MSGDPIRTLLVLPDDGWRAELCSHLTHNNFELVGNTVNELAAWTLVRETCPDLIIIASWLTDGLNLCRAIHTLHPSVTIVLVALDSHTEQFTALEAGVSGCIPRDFPLADWPSLLSYVNQGGAVISQVVLKQAFNGDCSAIPDPATVIVGPLAIDLAGQRVTLGRRRVCLSRREYTILACLAQHLGQVVTFDQLLNEALGCDPEAGAPTQVRLYVSRLRQKLGDDPDSPIFIVNQRGVGYRLRSPEQWHVSLPPCSADCFVAKLIRN